MKHFPLVLIPAMALPLHAAEQQADVVSAIRSFLPAAKKAEAVVRPEPTAPAPQPEPEPVAKADPAPAPVVVESTPDIERPADVSPEAHAKAYGDFLSLLDEQVKRNSEDYCPALSTVLTATNDEFAVLRWMEKAAEEGNVAAITYVADAKLRAVPHDQTQAPEVKEAFQMLKKAADKGFDFAVIQAYVCQRSGIGTNKDEKAAERMLMQACRGKGFLPRFKWLQFKGLLREYRDCERPEVVAEIERGNHHVMYYKAMLTPTTREQIEALQQAAIKGNAEALYALSAVCSKVKPKQSYELLQQAIKLHSAEAMWTLGGALTEVDSKNPLLKEAGITPDDKTGRHLLRLAALMGSTSASYWLGLAYDKGAYGIREDKERAYRHFAMGAGRANAACGAAQGLMLLRGIGVQQDIKRGLLLIRGAANAHYPYAVVMLAYAQFNGIGMPADGEKAITLLQEAAALGFPQAYVYMAYLTEKGGVNLPANASQADKYVRMAALDMKEEAQKLLEELKSSPEWHPHP